MPQLLANTGIIAYLKENIIITAILAAVLVLILALSIVMIVLKAKCKKLEEDAPAEEEKA